MTTQKQIKIGSRVRCNKGFAAAYVGQEGTIESTRQSAIGEGTLYVVRFDEPTAPAPSWTPNPRLGAPASCYDVIEEVAQ